MGVVAGPQTAGSRVWRELRGLLARRPRAADGVLAVVVFVVSVFRSDESTRDLAVRALADVPIAAFPVLAVASGALMWRRERPLAVLGVTLVASGVSAAFGLGSVMAQVVALYGVGRYVTDNRRTAFSLVVSMAFAVVHAVIIGSTLEIGAALFVTFVVWYVGLRVRNRGERAVLLEREQEAQARRVLAEERSRIARELHDVVAHRVSLMTVQAGAAKTVAAVDPQGAVQAMAEVEQAGREALGELRQVRYWPRSPGGPATPRSPSSCSSGPPR